MTIDKWTPTQIRFVVPDGTSGPPVSPGVGSLLVETADEVVSPTQSVRFVSPVQLPAPALPATSMYPGETVTLHGTGFGPDQGSGYVQLEQGNVSYGAPSNDYKVQITGWSNTAVSFVVPDGYSGPSIGEGSAELRVVTASGLQTPPVTVQVVSPPTVPIQVSPSGPVYPGETVTIRGTGFGSAEGPGYVQIVQGSTSYGAPGNVYKVAVSDWSNSVIRLVVPDGYSGPALSPGAASLQVVTAAALKSPVVPLVVEPPPILQASVSSSDVQPGQWITVIGDGFGATEGNGYVQITQGSVSYGAPGNWYGINVKQWTNAAVTLEIPTAGIVDGHSEPGLAAGPATLTVTTGSGRVTEPIALQVQ